MLHSVAERTGKNHSSQISLPLAVCSTPQVPMAVLEAPLCSAGASRWHLDKKFTHAWPLKAISHELEVSNKYF